MDRARARCAGASVLVLLAFGAAATPVSAQRGGPRRQTSSGQLGPERRGDRRAQAIRAEVAAVLLESGRYREAAREYRTLLVREPRRADYRLNLARALAWGGKPRAAERELREVRVRRPRDPAVEALLVSVRKSYDPTSREAAGWLAERPGHAPYRLALARALVHERRPRAALPHYDVLLALGRTVERVPPVGPTALLREAAEARVAAGDRAGGGRMLAAALARAPRDTAVRHALAVVLAASRRYGEALAQYDTLLGGRLVHEDTASGALVVTNLDVPPPEVRAVLLLERAQVHVARGDLRAAERDAVASLGARATAPGYVLLGDLGRWRGQYAVARSHYERARVIQPRSGAVTAAFARLAREERPALAFTPLEGGEAGWRTAGEVVGDNLGVRYATLGARRGAELPGRVVARVGVELRQLSERSALRAVDLPGFAASAAGSRDASAGALYGRAGARVGLVGHAGVPVAPEGELSVAGWYGAWGVGVSVSSALAYPSLLTVTSLRPSLTSVRAPDVDTASDDPLRDNATSVAVAGPVGRADLALVGRHSRLSDGNARSTVQLFGRYPLAPGLSGVYAGSATRFAERSALYWDPIRYVGHAAGLEYAVRRARGLAYAVQVLPGVAWSHEVLRSEGDSVFSVPAEDEVRQVAPQLTGMGEVAYRAGAWEAAAGLSYGRGRTGEYQRFGATVQVRVTP